MKGDAIVPFEAANASRCICPICPVQMFSKCSSEKLKNDPLSDPGGVPKLYCSSGKTLCKDLNGKSMCICGSCKVWKEFGLVKHKPTAYYCIKGRSA